MDTGTVYALFRISIYHHEKGRFDSALYYAKQSLLRSKKVKSNRHTIRALNNVGALFCDIQKQDSADYYLDKAIELSKATGDNEMLVFSLNSKAINSNSKSDFKGSIEYLLQVAAILEKNDIPQKERHIVMNYTNIGVNFVEEKQYEKAIAYFNKALSVKNFPEYKRFAIHIYSKAFQAYMELKDLEYAKLYLDSATQLIQSFNNIALLQKISKDAGQYYQAIGKLDSALVKYTQAYQLSDSVKVPLEKARAALSLGEIYHQLNQYSVSNRYALETRQISGELKNFLLLSSAYDLLKRNYSKLDNFKEALHYADSAKIYSDSSYNAETQKAILTLESRFQNSKKEAEIATLKVANAEKELSVIKKNRLLYTGGFILIALLFILVLFYRNAKHRQTIAEKEKQVQQQQISFLENQQQVISMQSMINGQEAERTRIARDLHDGLGGLFSTVKMYFSTLEHQEKSMQHNQLFKESYQLVDNAANEVRRIAHNMMPEVLLRMGLSKALKDLCNSINAGRKMEVVLQETGMDKRLEQSTEIMLFRIIQELLNNIMKHAESKKVLVELIRDENRLSVTVEDDGKGFDITDDDGKNHTGLASVKNRVHYLGGNIEIESGKGIGTSVMMHFPV
ncbi:MAG: sensor histidine kinase [Ferruginibacter sp.]